MRWQRCGSTSEAELGYLAASVPQSLVSADPGGFARRLDEGRIVEVGPPEQVLGAPTHERTQRFLRHLHEGRRL